MKVKDLLPMEIDVDVYDNVCEELAICFCGPIELTEAGKARFAEVLEYDCKLYCSRFDGNCAVINVDDPDEKVMMHKLEQAQRFFVSAAGYCADEDFSLWFVED